MKKFKTAPQPTPPSSRKPNPPSDKREIDAAIHALTRFIEKDPEKAAKIFESWLVSSGERKNTGTKKRAA
jgi:hypothetical protein